MPFTFVPGQFLNVTFWIGGARMNRSYSISSSPTQRDYVELTVHREPRGAVSRHINDLLKVGDQIEAGGPVGRFTFTGTEADSIVLIAAGVGIAPMMSTRAMLTELGVAPNQVKTELFGPTKPRPAAAGISYKPTAPATGPRVTFSKNNKSAKIHVDQTILELSEELAIGIEFSCRVGTCGVCKVKMTSGEVEMAVDDALEPDDKANGIILACQAMPKGDIAVEA